MAVYDPGTQTHRDNCKREQAAKRQSKDDWVIVALEADARDKNETHEKNRDVNHPAEETHSPHSPPRK